MRVYRLWPWSFIAVGLVVLILTMFVVLHRQVGREATAESPLSPDAATPGAESGEFTSGTDDPLTAPPPLPEPSSPFLNTRAGVAYIGTAACVECHPQEHRSYLQTKHSQSLSEVDVEKQPPDAEVKHALSNQHFRVERRNGQLWHESRLMLPGGGRYELAALPMHYVMGSGHFCYSYLSHVDGFLVQSPLTWYTPRAAWGMSPGYDNPTHAGFRRLVSTGCLFCHTGRTETLEENDFRVRLVEHSIGCERCHGPGFLHAEKQRGTASQNQKTVDDMDADWTIVNPAHLSRELGESVCQQCHLQGEVNVTVRGRRLDDFRPGLLLADFQLEYRLPTSDQQMTVVGHVQQLHASACYQHATDLTCTTCHDPHQMHAAGGATALSRAACLRCHGENATAVCSLPASQRQSQAENDCVRCHMPSAPTEIPHVAFTHHRIGVFPIQSTKVGRTPTGALEPLQDLGRLSKPERDRALGLALSKLADKATRSADAHVHWRRAVEFLKASYQFGFRDPEVTSRLAEAALLEKDTPRAARLALATLKQSPLPIDARLIAVNVLAKIRFQEQRFQESRIYYRELTHGWRSASHYLYLGMCEQNCGDTQAAVAALQDSARIEPIQIDAHVALASMFEAIRRPELAAEHRRNAQHIQDYWQTLHSTTK